MYESKKPYFYVFERGKDFVFKFASFQTLFVNIFDSV